MRRWGRFAGLSRRQRALLVEASLQLAWARVVLLVLPFRRLAARLGELSSPAGTAASRAPDPAAAVARDVRWAMACAARHVPFGAVCLPQAIAAKKMLARRGVKGVLHFGVARPREAAGSLEAHAWVDAAGIEVSGYPVASRFTELARFS